MKNLLKLSYLRKGVQDGTRTIAKGLEESRNALAKLNNSKYRQNVEVKDSIEKLTEQDVNRSLPFAERIKEQQ